MILEQYSHIKEVTVKEGGHIGAGYLKPGARYRTIPFDDSESAVIKSVFGITVAIHVPGINQHNKAYSSISRFKEFN